ncbi:MAG: polysaccharide biosynthesis C-terminal domain-containing protein [Oscillospiraceae bacterium]|nr:polysaccharide biosynthesis C-terminal domain-containing protein [Oscillospiraceae bacterium]
MVHAQNSRKLLTETVILSSFSVGLQGLGLLLNIFLTRQLGAASVGEITLIGSFYSLAAILSGGCGFIAASRFMSEELGCGGNPHRVYQYIKSFCMTLSILAAALLCIFAWLPEKLLHQPNLNAQTIRLLSASLPLSALSACLKGRCYAYNRVYLPAVSECIEFLLRAGTLAFCTLFLIPRGSMSVLTALALSMIAGQGSTVLFLSCIRMPHRENCNICSFSFGRFLRQLLPVMGNASLVAILSTTNDALVPLTLLQFGSSPTEALAQFGEFEAIIIPALFFPSVMQCVMSGLIVPELSRAKAAEDHHTIRLITERALEQTIAYALFIVMYLVQFGRQIGEVLGGDTFTGQILRFMAPVVPFIYLEIIMEGVLRGLGKHNFSSVNYLAEYIVRISVLLICVPMFGFYGIAASYLACNLSGNTVRLYFVLRLTGLKPVWKRILLRPAIALFGAWQIMLLMSKLCITLRLPAFAVMIICAAVSGLFYAGILYLINQPNIQSHRTKNCTGLSA